MINCVINKCTGGYAIFEETTCWIFSKLELWKTRVKIQFDKTHLSSKKSKLSSFIVWYIHVTFTDCGLILIVSGCKFVQYQNSHLIAKYLYTELNSKAYIFLNCLAINSSQISENMLYL